MSILQNMRNNQKQYELLLAMHVLLIIPERLRGDLGITAEMQYELAELAASSTDIYAVIPVALGTHLQNVTDMTSTDRQVLATLLEMAAKAISANRVVTSDAIMNGLADALKKSVEDGKKWADKQKLAVAPLSLDSQLEDAEKLIRAASTYNREAYAEKEANKD